MMPVAVAHGLLVGIVALGIGLMLLRPWGVAEAWWVCGGAGLLVALRLVPVKLAGHAVAEGTDVYLFLTGMMLVSELAREQGVFDWVAARAVRGARGSRGRLFALVYGVGVVVTVCLSNDATAVVLTPAILAAMRRAKVEPLAYLFACAMIANAASFVLPISNPANLVVFHAGLPPLGRWLAAFGVPSLLSIAATFAVLRWWFRGSLRGEIEVQAGAVAELTVEGRMVLVGLAAMVAVLLGASAMKMDLGLPTCLAAVTIAAAVSAKARANPLKLLREVSWATLALVAGLFVMVDAVESLGALGWTVAWLHFAERLGPAVGAVVAGFAVGVANNVVNNLPLGLIAGGTLRAAGFTAAAGGAQALMTHAVMIGVDLGPNLSVTGSLATILWLLALRREKIKVGSWAFLKVGIVAMAVAMAAALGALVIMERLSR
jgi:arsenical pump membrane protein